jgi:hypothetical protein
VNMTYLYRCILCRAPVHKPLRRCRLCYRATHPLRYDSTEAKKMTLVPGRAERIRRYSERAEKRLPLFDS